MNATELDSRVLADVREAAEALMRWRLPHDDAFTVTEGSRAAFRKLEAALNKARKAQP